MIVEINKKNLEITKKFQGMCKTPYYNHPKGCPNYGRTDKGCPPTKTFDEVFDLTKPIYLIYTVSNIGFGAEERKRDHPDWTLRQIYNSRFWQGGARAKLKKEENKFRSLYPQLKIESNPEARGVNLTKLMESIGIKLNWDWPPKHDLDNLTYRISLAGIKK